MKKVSLQYTKSATDDLHKLDRGIVRRIVKKIQENSELSDPLSHAKALSGNLAGIYRYRIGDYRALFELDKNR